MESPVPGWWEQAYELVCKVKTNPTDREEAREWAREASTVVEEFCPDMTTHQKVNMVADQIITNWGRHKE